MLLFRPALFLSIRPLCFPYIALILRFKMLLFPLIDRGPIPLAIFDDLGRPFPINKIGQVFADDLVPNFERVCHLDSQIVNLSGPLQQLQVGVAFGLAFGWKAMAIHYLRDGVVFVSAHIKKGGESSGVYPLSPSRRLMFYPLYAVDLRLEAPEPLLVSYWVTSEVIRALPTPV